MCPILLCQLERCPSSKPNSLDGVVGSHVLDSKDIFLLKPLLSMLPSPILPLTFPVLHSASPLKTESSSLDAGNCRFRLTSADERERALLPWKKLFHIPLYLSLFYYKL